MELSDLLAQHLRILPAVAAGLHRLGIHTVEDLLRHFPARYENVSDVKLIKDLVKDDMAIVYGKLGGLDTRRGWKRRIPMSEGWIEDSSGKMKLIWFNQPYIARMLHDGMEVKLTGRVTGKEEKLYIANPEVHNVHALPSDTHENLFETESASQKEEVLYPIYPESRGVSSKWIRHAVDKILRSGVLKTIDETIPPHVLDTYHLPGIQTALIWIHSPKKKSDAHAARKRFAFEEVFLIQISKQQNRKFVSSQPSCTIDPEPKALKEFIGRFPFELTNAQMRAVEAILADFKKPHAMARLLEGDVGSGKTAVAAVTAYATIMTKPNGRAYGSMQTAYMAPTEILAMQQFESFIKYFSHLPVQIGLITGSGCKKFPSKVNPDRATGISRAQLLRWVANGEIPILVGTHALIQKAVRFKNLAYVVIDEQHRFGTAQRQMLTRKDRIMPHLLSMTATPIPRTLALTIYGDLDITLLDEMPHGRKPVITDVIPPTKREETYEKVRTELRSGRQAYVICPRIDEPDPQKQLALYAKSVRAEAARLKKDIFQEYEIGILHSKMKPAEKDKIMKAFSDGRIDILVATSVVEVGVNVPNATVIIIEGAERFGLSQLHQLRGRVIRSNHQAYCFVFADAKGEITINRLNALKQAKNGFELAEFDLLQRGSGELYGRNQSGISDLAMEAMKNIKMVEAARNEAIRIIEEDPELAHHEVLRTINEEKKERLHFE